MVRRIIVGLFGAVSALNGVFMLAAGRRWYETIPGVVHSGPFNPHFVADIGAAFLTSGAALIAAAWKPKYWPAAIAGAGFIGLHGVIHLVDVATGRSHDVVTDVGLVILPAALTIWAVFPSKAIRNA